MMEYESRIKLINNLKEQLKRIKNLPSGPFYQSTHKCLADVYLEIGKEQDSIYHIVESQAVSLRYRAVDQIDRQCVKLAGCVDSADCRTPALEKKFLMLSSGLDNSNFDSVMDRLKDLPPEWTVVQLTTGYDPQQHIGNPCKVRQPPYMHVTRLDMHGGRPYTMMVPFTGRTALQRGNFLEDFQNELDFMRQQIVTLQQDFKKYHLNKLAASIRMQTAVKQIEVNWLQWWRCILIGQLVDKDLKFQLEAGLEKIVSGIKEWKRDATLCTHLLFQCLMASYSLSTVEVRKVVAYVTGLDLNSVECKKISQDICELGNSFPDLRLAKRHPVILIVDDTLKRVPWEVISVLNGHPVSRIHSLHFLHAMYKVYKHRINGGTVEGIDPSRGHYIVNPDKNLHQMEERMKSSLQSRFPEWGGTFGVKPTSEDFGHALQESDVFVYCGHGSGTQFLGTRQLQKLQVNAVALLFGCNSTGLTSFGARVESWSTAQCYTISCSPCVIATLWNVTDMEIDKVSTNLLHYWLPPTQEMREIIKTKQKCSSNITANKAKDFSFDLVKNTTPNWEQVPKLLDAIKHGRAASQLFMTSASLVAIGLPVELSLQKI